MNPETVQTEYLRHTVVEHDLTIPIRAYYTIPLWKKLNLFFYTGPQLQIGLAETDKIETHLSEATEAWLRAQGVHVDSYDKMAAGEVSRLNIQYGLGGIMIKDKSGARDFVRRRRSGKVRVTYKDLDEAKNVEASCIAVGDFYPQFGEKRCERGARSAECLQRAA